MDLIKLAEQGSIKEGIPEFAVGDTLKVHVKVVENKKERIQIFEGTVIKRQNGGSKENFTVRKLSSGIGVERTFPLNSPRIDKIEVIRRGKVRRAKLYYLRDKVGKATKVKEKARTQK
ncbi:MAG: 50S ribosomal protein L19 [Eubacteriaceae bacterium]|nr:50S ribosomal protein L19 [Eubacteriaceae bacterium]